MAKAENNRRSDEKRFVDVSTEPDKLLPPLPYSSKSESIPTLLDAIKPSEHLVEDLRKKAEEALSICKNPKDKLSRDQSAALYLYSMQWPKDKDSFYVMFNRALRNEDRTKLIPYHNYFKLFMSALNKLPSKEQQLWRGVVGDLTSRYLTGTTHVWWGASSCTNEVHVTGRFLGQTEKRTLFNIKCYDGKMIKDHSEFSNESETILPPGTYLTVVSSLSISGDACIVELKQVPPDPKLIAQPIFVASGALGKKDNNPHLIWSDPSVNESSDNKKTQEDLRDIFGNNFESFESADQCENFINLHKNRRLVLIVSGQIGRDLVPKIHTLSHVISIYVYCMDKQANEKWTKNYNKVKAVVVQSTDLIDEIEKEKKQIQQQISENPDSFGQSNLHSSAQSNITVYSPQSPLSGYEKSPLQPLQQALKPIYDLIPDLDRLAEKALIKCHYPNEDGLSRDESAAIYIHTMEGTEPEYSLYRLLNQDLSSGERHSLNNWFPYLKLFLTALCKLPSQRCTVWRAMKFDLSEQYREGMEDVWWRVISATINTSALDQNSFLGTHGTRTLFLIECENGKSISRYSYYSNEGDVLLMPGFYFKVTNVMKPASNFHIIHLKEIDPPFS